MNRIMNSKIQIWCKNNFFQSFSFFSKLCKRNGPRLDKTQYTFTSQYQNIFFNSKMIDWKKKHDLTSPIDILLGCSCCSHLAYITFTCSCYYRIENVFTWLDYFTGIYILRDKQWKESFTCKLAGFLSFLSGEVSAFNVCIITIDRFLILRFPFSTFR